MEINIDGDTRNELFNILFAADSSVIKFPSINSFVNQKDIEKYITMFDKSQTIVYQIIERDVWPRFRKSSEFNEYLQSLKSAASIVSIIAGIKKPLVIPWKHIQVNGTSNVA